MKKLADEFRAMFKRGGFVLTDELVDALVLVASRVDEIEKRHADFLLSLSSSSHELKHTASRVDAIEQRWEDSDNPVDICDTVLQLDKRLYEQRLRIDAIEKRHAEIDEGLKAMGGSDKTAGGMFVKLPKPCPFCGSGDVALDAIGPGVRSWFVKCRRCTAFGPSRKGESAASEAWNKRSIG